MNFISRLLLQTLALLLCIYCFLFVSVDLTAHSAPALSNSLLRHLDCVRHTPKQRWKEGVHYPNQLYYEYVVNKEPEEFIVTAPVLNPDTEAIILVLTKNTEERDRREIRRSWGSNYNPYLRNKTASLVFITANNDEDLGCLLAENREFGDLMIVKVLDSYRGLVYKLLMAYRYIVTHYPKAMLIKIDRDAVLDISGIMEHIYRQNSTEFIYGYLFYGSPPVRKQNHQWYVPESVFEKDWYPWYVNGNLYVISAKALAILMEHTNEVKILEIEDLFFTGILRAKTNLSVGWLHGYSLPTPNLRLCPTDDQRKMFAHGIYDKIEERYNNFLEWRVRECDVADNEKIWAEINATRQRAKETRERKALEKHEVATVVYRRTMKQETKRRIIID